MTTKGNKLDRAINFISPRWGFKRQQSRQMSAIIGGYDGSSTTSSIFQEFVTTTLSADSSYTTWDRKRLVDRSRYHVRNIPVATAIPNRICDHAIGDKGLALHPQVDRAVLGFNTEQAAKVQEDISNLWRFFSQSKDLDLNREQDFNEKTYLTLKSELEGGDCFTLLIDRKNKNGFNLTLQSAEGEYVSNPNGHTNTDTLVDGIVKDSNGTPTHVWFSKNHPGDRQTTTANKWQKRPIYGTATGRRVILHHKNIIRFGQTRGVPILGPVTGKVLQLGKLSDSELMASLLNSFFTIVATGNPADTQLAKTAPGEKNTSFSADTDKLTMGTGSFIRAKPGTKFESFDPNRPSALFEPFFKAIVKEIGAALGIPASVILLSFDKSYSASRGEVLLAWMFFLSKRTHTAVNFCQPVYESFLDEAVFKGMIQAPGYFSDPRIRKAYQGSAYNQWTGPTRPAIDELKEATAYKMYNELGTQSLQEITAKTTGREWLKVQEQLTIEHDLRVAAGLEEITMDIDLIDKQIKEEDNENT
jgi:lambda family phage portal protein